MSTATELAELEGAIAENELDTDEAERLRAIVNEGAEVNAALEQVLADRAATPEPAPPPPPPAAEPTAADLKAFEKENSRHERELRKIMGADFATFEPCDNCGGVGYAPPATPAPEPKSHEWFKACETCNGYGEVLTGSLRAGEQSRDCPECRGRGYLERLNAEGVPLADPHGARAEPIATTAAPPAEGASNPAAGERFGVPSWMGDPHLGQ